MNDRGKPADKPSAANENRKSPKAIDEAELLRLVSVGENIDLGGGRIEAGLLRRLISGLVSHCTITPFGVRVRNGEIVGRLDLEGIDFQFPLVFSAITMTAAGQNGSIVARDARIRRLHVSNCTFAGGIIADRARFENGIMIAGGRIGGPLQVRGAEIGGALAVEGAHVGDGKVAILAAGARVTGPLVLRRARAQGEVRLQRTHLAAGLRGDDLRITDAGAGFYCDAARIGGDVQLGGAAVEGPVRFENSTIDGSLTAPGFAISGTVDGFHASGLEISQSLDLSNARITGPLNLEGASIGKRFLAHGLDVNGAETAIAADIMRVGGNWEMPRARLVGQLRCPGARIGGQLRCSEARIYGGELAIRADGAQIHGGVFFSRAVISGGCRFPAVDVGNQFSFSGATIKVAEGAAIVASGAVLRRDAELNAGFQAIGGIIFDQAEIRGNCDLDGSRIKSAAIVHAQSGPSGPLSVRLLDAAVGSNSDTIALSLVDARIDRLALPSRVDDRPRGIVDLSRARIGAYVDWAATWPPPAGRDRVRASDVPDHLVLDGFTYEHLVNPAGVAIGEAGERHGSAGQRRIGWLLGQAASDTAERFKPQAWVYLSKQLTHQGLDRDARVITIERRRHERLSRWSTASARWESRFLDIFALYGFNPWRTVAWMAVVVLLFAGVWSWAAANCKAPGCFDERVFVTAKRDAFSPERFAERYPPFHPLAYSFDVFVPFVSFGYEEHWRPNVAHQPLATWRLPHLPAFLGGETDKQRIFAEVTPTVGGVLYVLVIIQKILGLILTSLMVTGFTGLLRSHE